MTYVLPPDKRGMLRQPIGAVLQEDELDGELSRPLVTVGDMVTATVRRRGVEPDLAVVDYQVERSPCGPRVKQAVQDAGVTVRQVANPAGVITDELWQAIEAGLAGDTSTRIEVDGEEDLASLAAIMLAPLGATVVYGLPSRGIARVTVTEDSKAKVKHVLQDMEE
ncbi:MAG: GTP-dependent dephospho-CoA kinase family protein [Candidatus Thermoplasmatota archaeon]|nr:GTP-dependent dephospho-CoA kinase family protein [Candidatus Thermoplasmatota archaeon]